MGDRVKRKTKVSAVRPKVTVSSCLCDQIGVQGYNKAGVEREAANQGPDGLAPSETETGEKKKKKSQWES